MNKSIRQKIEEFSYFDILNATSEKTEFDSAYFLRQVLYYREDLAVFWIDPLRFDL